jgi:hypothetical protein
MSMKNNTSNSPLDDTHKQYLKGLSDYLRANSVQLEFYANIRSTVGALTKFCTFNLEYQDV